MAAVRRPRLIASDLDGTFLSPDGTVSEDNTAAVARAAELGVPFVFATGRPSRWLSCLDDLSLAHPLVVVSNGAAVCDLATGALSQVQSIVPDVVVDVTSRIRGAAPDVVFGLEFPAGFACEPALPRDERVFFAAGEITDLVRRGEVMKVLVFSDDLSSEEMHTRLAPVIGADLEATYSAKATYGLLELMAPGVSKATSLATLCRDMGIDAAEVAAFGDMPNDVEMLDWAGMPYRMSEGHPRVAARGYPVAGSNADSGVGRTVMRLLSLP
ncbi:HAD hydrolase family protein [Propionicicella superfundia]|uniref:HAD hydrolase family protein n=1 Tax=Propionicicella superfundia TaxID=348582 RepID=UPI00041DCF7C|nr:HAD hydrolase family protein [Propionicicella superfundia]